MHRALALVCSTIAAFTIIVHGPGLTVAQVKPYVNSVKEFRGPLIYKSGESGILFYVESDGRHVSAIDPEGKILWCRDPFIDAGLKPYRVEKPLIVRIGTPAEWMSESLAGPGKKGEFVVINFNSTQTGVLSAASGEFTGPAHTNMLIQ
jgi:hypothetical protein